MPKSSRRGDLHLLAFELEHEDVDANIAEYERALEDRSLRELISLFSEGFGDG